MPVTLAPEQQEQMLSAARAAFKNAHAPYSNFKVGSTILTERGALYPHQCNRVAPAPRVRRAAAKSAGHRPPVADHRGHHSAVPRGAHGRPDECQGGLAGRAGLRRGVRADADGGQQGLRSTKHTPISSTSMPACCDAV